MKNISNLSEQNLKAIAKAVYGNLWMKGDKIRIYTEGGNNYHYDGKWYYEINADGTWEVKCYLTSGYGNSNREAYVAKHLRDMEERLEEVLNEEGEVSDEVVAPAAPVLEYNEELAKCLETCEPVEIVRNPNYKPKRTPVKRVAVLADTKMVDFYHGAKKYRVYVKDNYVIAITDNLSQPSNEPEGCQMYILDGSCTEICFNF